MLGLLASFFVISVFALTSPDASHDKEQSSPLQVHDDRSVSQGQHLPPVEAATLDPSILTVPELSQYIGWHIQDMPYQNCQGYYSEPNLFYEEAYKGPENQGPIHISTSQSEFSQTDVSILKGNVVLTQPNRRIETDVAYLNRNPTTKKIESVDVYGKVVLREPGNLLIADKGHLNLNDKSGSLNDVIYRMSFGKLLEPVDAMGNPLPQDIHNEFLNGWGIAREVTRLPDGVIEVTKGTYTACPPSQSDWRLKANNLTINRETGRGSAKGATLYLKEFPILYAPYFNFPIDDRRVSGFLYPTFGHSSRSGYEIGTPFYWNIAPNKDMTFTPDYMTERGLQLNDEFRYLTTNGRGDFHGSIIFHDRAFEHFQDTEPQVILSQGYVIPEQLAELQRLKRASDNRYFVSWKDYHSYNNYWNSYLYLNHVSDDYYFQDFRNDPAQVTDNQLINEADIFYNSEHWQFTGQTLGFQTLHPVNHGLVANQYKKLPELKLNGDYPDFINHWHFAITNQFDNFQINANPGEILTPTTGQRLYLDPELSLPKYWVWGFVRPDVQLTMTQYSLQNNFLIMDEVGSRVAREKDAITRVLPILDLDAGLFFDKQVNVFGTGYEQTFEPRFFYLYVPYTYQNNIPLFDTTIEPFSFSQLFRTNRFTGIDRIGDTNQISLAATTRFINIETGEEKARASIGQIYYFQQRKIKIDDSRLDLITYENQVPTNTYSSPIAAELDYQIVPFWSVLGDIAWDPNFARLNNTNILLQYKYDDRHLVNLGYNFLRGGDPNNDFRDPLYVDNNNLNQVDFSLVWPISRSWEFIGRWDYNISHQYPQTYYGGLEYDACCWSARFIAGREFDNLSNRNKPLFDHRIYFQVALKTLGNVGFNSPEHKLTSDIPGYVDNFGRVTPRSMHEDV